MGVFDHMTSRAHASVDTSDPDFEPNEVVDPTGTQFAVCKQLLIGAGFER